MTAVGAGGESDEEAFGAVVGDAGFAGFPGSAHGYGGVNGGGGRLLRDSRAGVLDDQSDEWPPRSPDVLRLVGAFDTPLFSFLGSGLEDEQGQMEVIDSVLVGRAGEP